MNPLVRPLGLISICALVGLAPASAAELGVVQKAELKAAGERWANAYGRGDLDTIAGLYTVDAKLLPEGRDAIGGRAAILEFFKKLRSPQSTESIRFSNFEFYGDDTTATEVSEIEITDQGKVVSRGKQILVRLKQNGQWKIHRDIWTMNQATKTD